MLVREARSRDCEAKPLLFPLLDPDPSKEISLHNFEQAKLSEPPKGERAGDRVKARLDAGLRVWSS